MRKLIETRLQKFILFVGGLLIFLRLWNVGYYERYNAILASIGILVLTIVLLIVLQDVSLKIDPQIIKKLVLFVVLAIFLLLITRINWQYFSFDRNKCLQEVAIRNASEIANLIDFDAYIKDLSLEKINTISKVFGVNKELLISAREQDLSLIKEINNRDILFIYNHPRWMENNLRKLKDLIKDSTISNEYITELINELKNSNVCKVSIFK